ncbi:cytochrome P450 71A19 isoform X1 [Arabidopsis lyrata subsp. lyrata]|uniref:cytochrome P450 71A19 isoform X1 n=1 Tax=Arabidopsis lyrata subsp. lyrata TaxID=81972 RepID=UPI000A29BF3D|nr:cytochrome P450 71A19 isoform X1 [Arabidopsis lyrata subsp. lyrata]|eukprot:XP_020877153.1 cytochrome P450 71A19 isoform X1 [Arabidopsis lyrata subsp. lyrata]
MEIIISITLCLTTLLALLLLKSILKRTTTTKLNLPPSPWRLPVIGNLHQLSLNTHRSLRSLSLQYGPLMLLHFGRTPVLIVSSADVAHDILKTYDVICANRPKTKVIDKILKGGRDVAFAPYGEYWRQIKSISIQNLLSNKMVRSYEKIREEEIKLMIEKMEKASCSSPPSPDMFLAGTATTLSFLAWAMTELMRHPKAMKKLQEEIRSSSPQDLFVTEKEAEKMNYLQAVIKEALRLRPPAPLLVPRVLSEDVTLKGYNIPAGTQVIINAWAIQRDTTTWGIDAEEFRPERHLDSNLDFQGQDFKFIPFGSGKRICPGIGFTSALIGVTLANILKRFNWRMDVEPQRVQHDLTEATGLVIFRKFPLIATPSPA